MTAILCGTKEIFQKFRKVSPIEGGGGEKVQTIFAKQTSSKVAPFLTLYRRIVNPTQNAGSKLLLKIYVPTFLPGKN